MPKGIYLHKSPSLETRLKQALSNLGQKRSEETKIKIGLASKGRIIYGKMNKNGKWYKNLMERLLYDNPMWKEENKEKIRLAHLIDKNPSAKKIRGRRRYRIWRQKVYQRDNWHCRICKIKCKNKLIAAHHLKSWAEYPELRYKVSNGITLCKNCHILVHQNKILIP